MTKEKQSNMATRLIETVAKLKDDQIFNLLQNQDYQELVDKMKSFTPEERERAQVVIDVAMVKKDALISKTNQGQDKTRNNQ